MLTTMLYIAIFSLSFPRDRMLLMERDVQSCMLLVYNCIAFFFHCRNIMRLIYRSLFYFLWLNVSRVRYPLNQIRLPLHIYRIGEYYYTYISFCIYFYLLLAQIQICIRSRWLFYLFFTRLLKSTVPSRFISVLP